MRKDVQEIFRMTPHEKQVMMFSATLSKDIRPVCKKFMQDVSQDSGGVVAPSSHPRQPGNIVGDHILRPCLHFSTANVSSKRNPDINMVSSNSCSSESYDWRSRLKSLKFGVG